MNYTFYLNLNLIVIHIQEHSEPRQKFFWKMKGILNTWVQRLTKIFALCVRPMRCTKPKLDQIHYKIRAVFNQGPYEDLTKTKVERFCNSAKFLSNYNKTGCYETMSQSWGLSQPLPRLSKKTQFWYLLILPLSQNKKQ